MLCVPGKNIASKGYEPRFKVDLTTHLEQTELAPRVGPCIVNPVVAVGSDRRGVEDVAVDFIAKFCGETQEGGCLLVALGAGGFLVSGMVFLVVLWKTVDWSRRYIAASRCSNCSRRS